MNQKKNTAVRTAPLFSPGNQKWIDFFTVIFCVLAVYGVIWAFTGMWPWRPAVYNSYVLQADAWLHGRLDLGQNYSYLEIASYQGKYYISFPPFPSYVMLPLVALFGLNTPDGLVALACTLLGAVYTLRLCWHYGKQGSSALFWTLLVTIGSNLLMTNTNAWVWFIAQNMSFALCMMAVYYAAVGKGGRALAFWACAVGCRPMQAIYIPVLLYLLYTELKKKNPQQTILQLFQKQWKWAIAPVIIAATYMILNYLRFGSIVEFGHNYLPEFLEAPEGQFSLSYIGENFKTLFRLPTAGQDGKLVFDQFNGMCIFLVSPVFISYVAYLIRSFVRKEQKQNRFLYIGILILVVIHIIALLMHKTMGGSHFGHRYINDTLPFIFLGLLLSLPEKDRFEKLNFPLLFLGLSLNLAGVVCYYNHWL